MVVVAEQPKPKRNKRKLLTIFGAVALTCIMLTAVFVFRDKLPFVQKKDNASLVQDSKQSSFVPKSPTADEALFPSSDSKEALTTRLADMQATIDSQTSDLSWEKVSKKSDSREGQKTATVWCRRSAPNTSQINCELEAKGVLSSELGQKINLETYEAFPMIRFHNQYQDYDFTYVERAPNDDNRFALAFRDRNIAPVIASRLAVELSLPGVSLNKTNAVQASAVSSRSLKEELKVYLSSADSLKQYATAQLQSLSTHAQELITKDGVKKYVECRTIDGKEQKEECKLENLTNKEKSQLIAQVKKDIVAYAASVDKNYQIMHDALLEASLSKECPGCWK